MIPTNLLAFIRSLGTGGCFGAGMLTLTDEALKVLYPSLSLPGFSSVAITGALIGFGVHQYAASGLDRFFLGPLKAASDGSLPLIRILLTWNLIPEQDRRSLLDNAVRNFIGLKQLQLPDRSEDTNYIDAEVIEPDAEKKPKKSS